MATSHEKYQLILEAREAASKKIKDLNRQIKDLGGPSMVKSQKEIRKLERQVKLLGGTANAGKPILSRFVKGIALGNTIAMAATSAFIAMKRAITDALSAAANKIMDYEATMISLKEVSRTTFRDYNDVLAAMGTQMGGLADKAQVASGYLKGLTTTLTVDQITKMTQAVKDASIAMGEDFGTQLPLIIKAIKQLNPNILDNIGVTVRLDQVNKRIREGYYGMGKAVNEATQQHAIFTEIMKQTAKFAGQEAKFLTTLKGKWTVLKTAATDALMDIGNALMDAFSTDAKDGLTEITSAIKVVGENASSVANIFIGVARIIVNALQIIKDSIQVMLSPLVDGFVAAVMVLKGEFSTALDQVTGIMDNLNKESVDVNNNLNDLYDSILQLSQGIADFDSQTGGGGLALEIPIKFPLPTEVAEEATHFVDTLGVITRSQITDPFLDVGHIMPGPEDTLPITMEINRQIRQNISADIVGRQQARFAAAFSRIGQTGMDRLSHAIASGKGKISDIFSDMAQDFMAFFIKQALAMVANAFIPGLGSALGGIFDTPVNDRMAAEQGAHFMHYFTQGALRRLDRGSDIVDGIIPSAGNAGVPAMSGPALAGAGVMGGSSSVIHVTITGNVMSNEFIERNVAPTLRRLVSDGKSDLALEPENQTGGRDVRLH